MWQYSVKGDILKQIRENERSNGVEVSQIIGSYDKIMSSQESFDNIVEMILFDKILEKTEFFS